MIISFFIQVGVYKPLTGHTLISFINTSSPYTAMLKQFTPRDYQKTIVDTTAQHNTLVVLPTGLGKTNVFLMTVARRLALYPKSKILFLGPTRPLIEQYKKVFEQHLDIPVGKMVMFTGKVAPEKRQQLWEHASIIFSTPQSIEHDLLNKKLELSQVSLLGIDEAHRAVGKYSYVWIAEQYIEQASHPRVVALTASPGSEKNKIKELCNNLSIEKIEVRTEEDEDVKHYVQEKKTNYVYVELPVSFQPLLQALRQCIARKIREVQSFGFLKYSESKTELLRTQATLRANLMRGGKDVRTLRSISLLAQAIKISHAIELAESQGIPPLYTYLCKLMDEAEQHKTKAAQQLAQDTDFKTAFIHAEKLFNKNVEHPKMKKLRQLIISQFNKSSSVKFIVFTQYRDTALLIKEYLSKIEVLHPEIFVGQSRKGLTGMSQKEQKRLLEQFGDNQFNVLVATSIGEEGLDIPQVNAVIFFEPVPSAIRQIQRSGRTGRQSAGDVFILLARGTRDEIFRWVAHHKQKNMYRVLQELKQTLLLEGFVNKKKQHRESDKIKKNNDEANTKIFIDHREKANILPKKLLEYGIDIELTRLDIGDYLLGKDCCVEFKTVPDFVASILDGRLLQQARALRTHYPHAIIIIEGSEDLYAVRNVHPHAIQGAFAALLKFNISIIQTKTPHETASLLVILAKSEQQEGKSFIPVHHQKPQNMKAQQEFVIASLPGIESSLAPKLLDVFGSVRNVMNASEDELKGVPLIGTKKAGQISSLVSVAYPTQFNS